MFRVNDRWLHPEPEPERRAPMRAEVEVWHDYSGMTSTGQVCIDRGERDEAASGFKGWETRRANGNGKS